PLSDLKNLDLQKIGLKISPQELYNPNGTSLIDAIVRVGGCTGSFVSAEGLIVTNHHCAFGFAAAASTSANNYAKHGFLARNASEEIPAKGLVCKITASYADVSERVLQGTAQLTDPIARLRKIGENIKAVTRLENEANPDLQCEISEMFTGRTYVLFRYKLLKDVRLVYVPARSI
ncbi:MAG: S46 family peptidase, partial [Bacteroidota bacterium]